MVVDNVTKLRGINICWRVKIYDTEGNLVSVEYTDTFAELDDMRAVPVGFFTDTIKLIRKT